jgi:hypothetical protein
MLAQIGAHAAAKFAERLAPFEVYSAAGRYPWCNSVFAFHAEAADNVHNLKREPEGKRMTVPLILRVVFRRIF